jgi:hypothetical protein
MVTNMYIQSINQRQFACFTQPELRALHKAASIQELNSEMERRGVTIEDIMHDRAQMQEIANVAGDRGAANRDEHEIFAALFIFAQFYGTGSHICFELQNIFNANQDRISSLADLIRFRKIDTESDFMIRTGNDFRDFQLKRYRGVLDLDAIFDFIVEVVRHYGNNLGDTNLLIVLQSPDYTRMDIDFHELHNRITAVGFLFLGHVLISYNNNNTTQEIIQVHPELGRTNLPFQLPSQRQQ